MDIQQKKCVMYVDYEGLLVGLSHIQYLDIDNLLAALLEKARQRFQVQSAIVLGNWTRHESRKQLESQGFICRSIFGTGIEISQKIQLSIAESLATGKAAEVYVLVNEKSDHNALLRQLRQADKESVLWTLVPPLASDQALCSEWELVTLPGMPERNAWPRQIMLQAVALAADHLENNAKTPFLMSHLLDHLQQLRTFDGVADTWLTIAIKEQILLLQPSGDPFDVPHGYLNRQHVVVQKALLTRERILGTLSAMLVDREWVAFSALEKALRTSKFLAESQSFRHAWLELLVAEGVLVANRIPQPDGSFLVTTLSPNPEHAVITTLQHQQYLNLVRLIIIVSDFTIRKGHSWMAVSSLLKILTKATTRVETRAALGAAEIQGIAQIGSVPSQKNPTFSTTTVQLNQSHMLVQETLAQRDQLIALTNAVLTGRDVGVSETLLAEEFIAACQMQKDEALFWIEVFVSEGILSVDEIPLGSSDVTNIMRLEYQDAIVDQVLDKVSKRIREVKQ